jgi:hypothetical protein
MNSHAKTGTSEGTEQLKAQPAAGTQVKHHFCRLSVFFLYFCIGVFLDLKKAFNVCSHEILLKKLQKMGIRGNTYKWFENYLAGRSQFVDINGSKSDPLDINISVIQGSILGPILFLCYINDFYTATTLFSVLFADDTTGLGKGKNLRELTLFVNGEL